MPSLPTSLIVVGLVAAWLVVLVPMVAKRREHVPDSDDEGAGFRVLRRATRSIRRRRPVMSRTAVIAGSGDSARGLEDSEDFGGSEDFEGSEDFGAGAEGDEAWDDGRGEDLDETAGDDGAFGEDEPFGDGDDLREGRTVRAREDVARVEASADAGVAEVAAVDEPAERRAYRSGRTLDRGAARGMRDRYDDPDGDRDRDETPDDRHRSSGRARPADAERQDREAARTGDWREGARMRPVPVRPGRGGFDPTAAEQARAYRYRQRRRVAVVLLALAVVCAILGVVGVSLAWAGAVCAFVLLALYLAYLRRQVRIEETIRQRRASRLERARQIRPVYRASVAEQVRAHRTGSLPRPEDGEVPAVGGEADAPYRVTSHARPASSVPPASYARGVPVDLDDDDPAFDDLEYYRPTAYRRASGE